MNKSPFIGTFYSQFDKREDSLLRKINMQLLLLAVTAVLLAGCNTYTDEGAEINQVYNENGPRILENNQEYRSTSYNQTYRMRGDEDLEEQVEMLNEVQSATVITVQRKAYVAVVLETGNTKDLPVEVNKKISDQIKSVNGTITEVYASTNADFVVKMTDYREQLQSGRPIVGLAEDFNSTIERIFSVDR